MKKSISRSVAITVICILLVPAILISDASAQHNIASAKDRMEELSPQMADAHCDAAYDRVYRFGEILYRIRIKFRRAQQLEPLLVKAQFDKERFGSMLAHFDDAVTQLQTAHDTLHTALEPFENSWESGTLIYSDNGTTVSSHSQAMLAAIVSINNAMTGVRNESSQLDDFYVDADLVLFDPYLATYSEIMRLSFSTLIRGLNLVLVQGQGLAQDTSLHLQTLPFYLEANRFWRQIEIYLNAVLPDNRTYAQDLHNLLDGAFSRIVHEQQDIGEEATPLVEEAEALLEETQAICHQQFRMDTYVPYKINPALLKRLLKDAERVNARGGFRRLGD